MDTIRIGLDNLIESPPAWLENKRLGLLCNPASVNAELVHAKDLIYGKFGSRFKALFSPQHGLYAEKQDNMVESDDFYDPSLRIPVFSLYGKTRRPTDDMLALIDVLIVDLLDVGTRVYTFLTTLSYCLEEAAKAGKTVVVLTDPIPSAASRWKGTCSSQNTHPSWGAMRFRCVTD